MATIVSIKQATDQVRCDANGSGICKFFVTNVYNDRQLRLKARVVVDKGAEEKWFTIQPSAEWKLALSETVEISVNLQVPKSTPDGKYGFHLQVFSVDSPDEDYKDGELVYFQIQNAKVDPLPPPPFPWWIVAVVLVVLLTIGGVAWMLLSKTGPEPSKEAKIPDLKGLIWDEAQQRLQQAGFSKFQTDYKFDPSKRDPIVLDQTPPKDTPAKPEDTIKVVLSFPGVPVPNLKGQTLLAAAQTLASNSLVLGEAKPQPTDAQAEQTVIDQIPPAGQPVDKGTPITLIVATKPSIPIILWPPRAVQIMQQQKMIYGVVPRGLPPEGTTK